MTRGSLLRPPTLFSLLLPTVALVAQPPQHTVVPAAYETSDAVGMLRVAGGHSALRHQTLIGANHLIDMVGRSIQAIALRRSAADETYQGGVGELTVTLSTSPRTPLTTSRLYANNVGNDAVQVYAGNVTLPTSPPQLGPNVAWSANNTVRIAFQVPFTYTGGTLCVDLIGAALPGQEAGWWVADAISEVIQGTSTTYGQGCGAYGGTNGNWAPRSTACLVPGGYARFNAYGPPGGLAMAAFGTLSPLPIPLTALGLPSPGCSLHLSSIDVLVPEVFEAALDPALAYLPGHAAVEFWLPNNTVMYGLPLNVQWFDFTQLATSNALHCTLAHSMHSIGMSCVEGHPSESTGYATTHIAHVMRFEHQ